MLDWMFKKNEAPPPDRPAAPDATPPDAVDWQRELQAALGDDAALLALARAGAPVDVKVAAIGAVASEAALKLAEREYRDHDRRVHRLAKQRLLEQIGRRETDEQSARLIEAAQALRAEPLIPANRLVELDRGWRALDPALLDERRRTEFEALFAQLAALTRAHGDERLKVERWTRAAGDALARLHAACRAAAAGTSERSELDAAGAAARAAVDSAPETAAAAALRESLLGALQSVAPLGQRLAALDELQQAVHPPPDAAARWQQLPALPDVPLADILNRRFEQSQQAHDEAQQARRSERRERAVERERGKRSERGEALAAALERAEAALGAGHLADTNEQLVEIDALLHGGASAGALRGRIDALQAEYARLKGWQHWGGGLARDELVLQAEALAAATAGDARARIVKLSIKQQAEVIDDLRARWKELDRLGGATSRSLWQRFDSALKAAYQPVAAHLDAQHAARRENLQARNALIDALNALAVPDANDPARAAPDWKSMAAALAHFQTEWRKLGPPEHTVPHKEREPLLARMSAAVARLEAPLDEARRGARLVRERLIAQAKALAAAAAGGAQGRELVDNVRRLQAEWQQHARELPLARSAENALWLEFKADIDAVFSAREAVFNARDAQLKAHATERSALIERLAALGADTPPAELERTLVDVDAQWQRAGPAPRNEGAALEARFRAVRDAAQRLLAGTAQRQWHATCDALLAKLALCEAIERGGGPAADGEPPLGQRWAALPALPASWEQALSQRAGLSAARAGTGPRSAETTDELLLQLEAAYQLGSPAAFEATRRRMKLQAMKAALEGRASAAAAPLAPAQLLAAALGRPALDAQQRERLQAVIAAVRERGPTPP